MKILSNKKYNRLIIEIETLKEIRENDEMCINMMADRINRLNKLEKENKKLKEMSGKLGEMNGKLGERVNNLEEENKKLREDNRFLTKISKEYMEKENIVQITELAGLYKDDLEKENERLKEELEECQCSFGFESDEVGYRKREYKRLKKWIKDHCKGYGNLFPEDEMKRQWKKADKKRK